LNTTITATAKYIPEKILSNFDLEKIVDTTDDWIKSRTGITKRHIVQEGEATSDMCANIAKKLLKSSGKTPEEIDIIIIATSTPDHFVVSTAAIVQDKIGAINAWAYDLTAACTGFIFALETGARLIESGKYKNAIIIGADTMSSIIDYKDRNTCVIFGDGGGGVLIEQTDDDYGIVDSILKTDGSGNQFLTVPAGGSRKPASETTVKQRLHYVYQDGKTVFKYAVNRMSEVSKEIIEKNKLSSHDIKLFIPHQANQRIIDATARKCGLDLDQVFVNIDKYGNTTAGTIPIAIDEANKMNLLKSGELLLLAAFGGGFTWGSMLIRWGKML
jgi:3-oxoacyl-[acyl-carrier-protein] synthase-3